MTSETTLQESADFNELLALLLMILVLPLTLPFTIPLALAGAWG